MAASRPLAQPADAPVLLKPEASGCLKAEPNLGVLRQFVAQPGSFGQLAAHHHALLQQQAAAMVAGGAGEAGAAGGPAVVGGIITYSVCVCLEASTVHVRGGVLCVLVRMKMRMWMNGCLCGLGFDVCGVCV